MANEGAFCEQSSYARCLKARLSGAKMKRLLTAAGLLFVCGSAGVAAAAPIGATAINAGDWISSNDYPSAALREDRGGRVTFSVTVGPDGSAQRCDIVISSGSPDIDAVTCDVIMRRARFNPARDASGKAATGTYKSSVNWTIPVDSQPAPTNLASGAQPAAPMQPATATIPAAPTRPAALGPRYALVVGNAQYGTSLGSLTNPVRDAQLIAQALQASGFSVEVVTNANQRTLKLAIARFGQRLLAAGKQSTGLFYYAGHGVQAHGVNYLIPVDAAIETEADVDLDGVPADAVVSQMAQAGASTSIVILDACRNMPLARQTRGGERGLARMEAPNGSYIAYSTAPGQTATDGTGLNSPFALALVAEMAKRDTPIESMFRNVRNAVYRATDGKQTPWDSSSLFDDFVFSPSRQ